MRWLDATIGVLVGVLLAGIALWVASPPRPHPIILEPPPPPPTPAPLVVDVAGAVNHPGVYALPRGSRVQDAVQAAGGFSPQADPDAVNLAAFIADGMRIYIPKRGVPTPVPVSSSGAAPISSPTALLDINTATAEELETVPHIGPTLAERIIEYRQEHGPFHQVDDLLAVKGIGKALLEKIKPYLTVSGVSR